MGHPDPPPSNPPGQNEPPPQNEQPPQYGPRPPFPPAPPPRSNNTGLILLLAISLPLLLLGGCGAVALVVVNVGKEAVREVAALEAEPPTVELPSQPPASPPPTARKRLHSTLGGSLTLTGGRESNPDLKVTVTLTKVVDPATPYPGEQPEKGEKIVAIELTLVNIGQAVYDGSLNPVLIDKEGERYQPAFARVKEGPDLDLFIMDTNDTRKGMVRFQLPESVEPVRFQLPLAGAADQEGEWRLN